MRHSTHYARHLIGLMVALVALTSWKGGLGYSWSEPGSSALASKLKAGSSAGKPLASVPATAAHQDTEAPAKIGELTPLPGRFGMRQRQGTLTLKERVAYQRAIEGVYWRHRLWPKENPVPKPALGQVMPLSAIRAKVEDSLRKSRALEVYLQRPINGQQLQGEMERMARQTKRPKVLRELWAALGNDPYVIAECLARPSLVNRLVRNWYVYDERYHGAVKHGAEEAAVQVAEREYAYRLPDAGSEFASRTDDAWTPPLVPAPSARSMHTAVWTGSEMIVWGGWDGLHALNTGGRYDPAMDSWADTSTTLAPTARFDHTAVWTGSEMIIWGGEFINTGGRYDPAADSWVATSTTNAPSPRLFHTAVWTGSEMIVWGGYNLGVATNTGGRYDPAMNSWVDTSTTNAPSPRFDHTAVWTGSEMVVWGGTQIMVGEINTGGRYDPMTDSWVATSITTDTPSPRTRHTAVWTGSEMVVWGGTQIGVGEINTGGRYDPAMDTWAATSITTDTPSPRTRHTAVWTGSEMVVWGGTQIGVGDTNTGGRYNPAMDTWAATSITTDTPSPRTRHTAVWTGSEMVVWGGFQSFVGPRNTGGRYDPAMNSWVATFVK